MRPAPPGADGFLVWKTAPGRDPTEVDMDDLSGKIAVITGGASERGIGRATAALLAQHGAKVVVADVQESALDLAVKNLRTSGADAIGVVTDVADFASVERLANAAYDHYGRVDIAFFNAGIGGGIN